MHRYATLSISYILRSNDQITKVAYTSRQMSFPMCALCLEENFDLNTTHISIYFQEIPNLVVEAFKNSKFSLMLTSNPEAL